jgi:hypothetical protein
MLKHFCLVIVFLCLFCTASFAANIDYFSVGVDPSGYNSNTFLIRGQVYLASDTYISYNSPTQSSFYEFQANLFDGSMLPSCSPVVDGVSQCAIPFYSDVSCTNPNMYDHSNCSWNSGYIVFNGTLRPDLDGYYYVTFSSTDFFFNMYQEGLDTSLVPPASITGSYDLSLSHQSDLFFYRITIWGR